MDYEKNVEYDLDNFMRECDSFFKEKASLLVRTKAVLEQKNSKLNEELLKREVKCEELSRTIARLVEEQKKNRDKEEALKEMYEKVCEENSKLAIEKNNLLSENEEIKKNNSELEDKFQQLDVRVEKLSQVIGDLVSKKLASDQTIEELRQKKLKAYQAVEELGSQNVEANHTIDELRHKLVEADRVTEELKRRNLEATHTINKLRQKKLESDEVATPKKSVDRILVRSGMKGDTDLSSGCNTPQAKASNANHGSGCDRRQGLINEGCSTTRTRPSLASQDIIEIDDEDSEDDENNQIPQFGRKSTTRAACDNSHVFGGLKDEEELFLVDDSRR